MTDLDKKTKPVQTDLVQSVLEAVEKRNPERVDMLVVNAVKQLKMSRFKPDQTTIISLVYLARTNPDLFAQSAAIKDILKSLLRREAGPTTVKGKNDIIVPVLAANILLASCDSADIRTMVLQKIEHWIGPNQKVAETIQDLLVTLCIKCQGDRTTINSLIKMRAYWMRHLEINHDTFGPVPTDLCSSLRELLRCETNCESLISYLNFLIKHDAGVELLSREVSRFVIDRPITIQSLLHEPNFGLELYKILLRIYTKLLNHLIINPPMKLMKGKDEPLLFARLTQRDIPIGVERVTVEAIFTLLSIDNELSSASESEFNELLDCWLAKEEQNKQIAILYDDLAQTQVHNLKLELRQRLIHSPDELLIEFGLRNADVSQLTSLLQLFGSPVDTINRIIKTLESADATAIQSEIKDFSFFSQLIDFYSSLGASKAKQLHQRLVTPPASG